MNTIYNNKADVYITELDFSTINGKSLVSTVHEVYPDVPLIILTKADDTSVIVETFKLGADDYVTKPFDFQVLLARVKARLHEYQNESVLLYKDIKFDLDKKLVYKSEKRLVLSSKEYHLLLYLIQNKGRVITRDELLDRVWEMEKFVSTRSVDVYIGRLRKKLGEGVIRTRRGFGYLLND